MSSSASASGSFDEDGRRITTDEDLSVDGSGTLVDEDSSSGGFGKFAEDSSLVIRSENIEGVSRVPWCSRL